VQPGSPQYSSDCTVIGASFAGLACASALAQQGLRVVIAEKKSDPGEKLHTTGILVKDVIDEVPQSVAHRVLKTQSAEEALQVLPTTTQRAEGSFVVNRAPLKAPVHPAALRGNQARAPRPPKYCAFSILSRCLRTRDGWPNVYLEPGR